MSISVLIRNKNDPNVTRCISSFENLPQGHYELVIIDSSDQPLDMSGFTVNAVYEQRDVSRFEALLLGLSLATSDRILILDSDQIVTGELISHLNSTENDMCIISEKSLNRNFVGRLSDRHREFLYEHSKQNVSDILPVIPRFYRKPLMMRAITNVSSKELSMISQHEDSVIYSEALRISTDVGFCDTPIYNEDPPFSVFAVKSFRYGLSQARSLASEHISPEKKKLLRSIDRNRILYSKTEGFNRGILYDMIKAAFYILGLMAGKLSEAM